MKLFMITSAAVIGAAVAFLSPARPVQMGMNPAKSVSVGLDNPNIVADPNIHPSRKCKSSTKWCVDYRTPIEKLWKIWFRRQAGASGRHLRLCRVRALYILKRICSSVARVSPVFMFYLYGMNRRILLGMSRADQLPSLRPLRGRGRTLLDHALPSCA
jgi:hypothetical protein